MSNGDSSLATTSGFDLGAYLNRVGLQGRPSLERVHLAHLTSIPFENLDPRRGVPVSLAPGDLARKLVGERRGGICFEHNLLLKEALEGMGMRVDVFLARVRTGSAPRIDRPRSHPVLRVWRGGIPWLADVGFGTGGILEPLVCEPGSESTQLGWRFRIVEDGFEQVLQVGTAGGWTDLYGFVPEPMPPIEIEVSSWFTSTHPESRFVRGLCVSHQRPDGSRSILSDWNGALTLTEASPESADATPVEWERVPELLVAEFGLPAFAAGPGELPHPRLTATNASPPSAEAELYCVVGRRALLQGEVPREAASFQLAAIAAGEEIATFACAIAGGVAEIEIRGAGRDRPAQAIAEATRLFLRLAAKLQGANLESFLLAPDPDAVEAVELLPAAGLPVRRLGGRYGIDRGAAVPSRAVKAPAGDMEGVYADPLDVPWNFVPVTTDLIRPLLAATPPRGRVLDLGCGYGKNLRYLVASGMRATGIEIAAQAVERAREVVPGAAELVVGTALQLPWPDGSFDAILDAGCIHCLPAADRPAAIREASRVLSPGGRLFSAILPPQGEKWAEALPFEAKRFGIDPAEARELLGLGFEEIVATPHQHITNLVASSPRS